MLKVAPSAQYISDPSRHKDPDSRSRECCVALSELTVVRAAPTLSGRRMSKQRTGAGNRAFALSLDDLAMAVRLIKDDRTVFADVFAERRVATSVTVEDGRPAYSSRSVGSGVGLRRIGRDRARYESHETLSRESLMAAARRFADGEESPRDAVFDHGSSLVREGPLTPGARSKGWRVLARVGEAVRSAIDGVVRVDVNCESAWQEVQVANSVGCLGSDRRVWGMVRLRVDVRRGDTHLSTSFSSECPPDYPRLTSRAMRSLRTRVDALLGGSRVDAGRYAVILPPGSGAVFFHETCGHALEADAGDVHLGSGGSMVASPLLTLIDDGTLPRRPGSIRIDDEGLPSSRRVLIDRGRLKCRIEDQFTAHTARRRPAAGGNARRESFRHMPLPRMTNLLVAAGPHGTLVDICRDTSRGFLAGPLETGTVDLHQRAFSFTVPYGYVVERGRVARSTGPAVISGRITDALDAIDRVGQDVAFDNSASFCVKGGQILRVGLAQPAVRIEGLDVTPL